MEIIIADQQQEEQFSWRNAPIRNPGSPISLLGVSREISKILQDLPQAWKDRNYLHTIRMTGKKWTERKLRHTDSWQITLAESAMYRSILPILQMQNGSRQQTMISTLIRTIRDMEPSSR